MVYTTIVVSCKCVLIIFIIYLFHVSLRLGYPYNIGVPSILHKYDIDDPESVIKAKRVFEDNRQENDDDDIDYGMNLRIVYRQTRGCYWHCVFE